MACGGTPAAGRLTGSAGHATHATQVPAAPSRATQLRPHSRAARLQPARAGARARALAGDDRDLITFEEVQQAARNRGLAITLTELGPFYRIICRTAQGAASTGSGGDGEGILALTTGFVAPPFGLMHCDTLQVFTAGMKGDTGDRIRGGALGLGLLMGGAVFSHGLRSGCSKAEILAINDDETWQKRLVRYYSFFGFEPVLVVEGDKLSDLPHMLVWGGAGTRMDADVRRMLRKWTKTLRKSAVAPATAAAGREGVGDAGPEDAAGPTDALP